MDRVYCSEDTDFWQRFYLDYLPDRPGRTPFKWRAFGDGGYLDNKPFTYAIETIMKRRADLPVDRKLVYIEPSPENPGEGEGAERKSGDDRPDAAQNSLKALVELPRYETIRQDLEQLLAWNNNVSRIKRVVAHIEGLVRERREPLNRGAIAFQSYLRLRLSSVTDAVSDRVVKSLKLDLKSADAAAIRALAGVWRDEAVKDEEAQQRFLDTYDIEYCRRAIRHARKRVRREHLSRYSDQTPPAEGIPADIRELYGGIAEADHILARAANLTTVIDPAAIPATMRDDLRLIVDPGRVNAMMKEPMPLMMTATEAGKSSRAEWALRTHGWKEIIDGLDAALTEKYEGPLKQVRAIIDPILTSYMGEDGFLFYDSLLFPVTFATELGEIGPVDVSRVSPQDCRPLEGVDREGRGPLKGSQFGAFGGFLDKSWRLHDMLRGRLDGAERLISAILPATDGRTSAVRDVLIAEAQEAIALDWEENLPALTPQPNEAASAAGPAANGAANENESGRATGRFMGRAESFLASIVKGR
jgi:patatin-related protein